MGIGVILCIIGIFVFIWIIDKELTTKPKTNNSRNTSTPTSLYKQNQERGIVGENKIYDALISCGETKILKNLYVPFNNFQNSQTTEVDLIAINKKGIFVFESKNYKGWIYGSEYYEYWTQTFKTIDNKKFYNPVKQNKTHISALDTYLNKKYAKCFYSFIVFGNECVLKDINIMSGEAKVIQLKDLPAGYGDTLKALPDILEDTNILEIYNSLKNCCNVSQTVKDLHIANINKRIKQ